METQEIQELELECLGLMRRWECCNCKFDASGIHDVDYHLKRGNLTRICG